MTYKEALNFNQKWTAQQAFNDLERYLLRDEPPAYKAIALGMQALEKQIPKTPKLDVIFPSGTTWYICPKCRHNAIEISDQYCHKCGQAFEWGEYIG